MIRTFKRRNYFKFIHFRVQGFPFYFSGDKVEVHFVFSAHLEDASPNLGIVYIENFRQYDFSRLSSATAETRSSVDTTSESSKSESSTETSIAEMESRFGPYLMHNVYNAVTGYFKIRGKLSLNTAVIFTDNETL